MAHAAAFHSNGNNRLGDISVQLNHRVPDTQVQTVYMRKFEEHDIPKHSGENLSIDTIVHDGRGQSLKLDEASFELVEHPTALAAEDFYNDESKVRTQYYEEMKALFTKVTGSPHVMIFHHQVRNEERQDKRVMKDGSVTTSAPVQPYAHGIHSDSSCFHAEQMFKQMVSQMPEECQHGRFLYINAWRNIADTPIQNDHLAVLDERSLVKPDDYIQSHLFGVGYNVLQYVLSSRNARHHKWYYFPKMVKDEVLVFKQWDSDPLLSGRLCFHTAIKDPVAPSGIPCRQSIETRAFVFFPDHEPNTCPILPPRPSDGKGGATATVVAEKLTDAVSYMLSDEATRLMIVGFMKNMHSSGGAEAVLTEFAEDRQGHFSFGDLSSETKKRGVELALENGVGKKVDKIFVGGPSATRLAFGMLFKNFGVLLESRVFAAFAGAALSLAARSFLTRARRC